MNISHKGVSKAINHIMVKHPFYGSIMMQQNIVEDYSCKTFWVDGTSLGFNPNFADTLSFEEICGVLIHELYHLIFMHHCRMQYRKHELWNEAADYAINTMIIKMGFKLPSGALLDYKYDNKSAEEVYRLRSIEEEDKQKEESKDDSNDDNSDDKGDDKPDDKGDDKGSDPNDDSDEESDNDSDYNGSGDKESDKESDKDGNGSSNSDSDKESDKEGNGKGNSNGEGKESNEPVTFGEVRKAKDPQKAEQNIKAQVRMAEVAAKQAGCMPSDDILGKIKTSHETKYNWVALLNRFITDVSNRDFSFDCPDYRFLGDGLVIPDAYNNAIGEIVFAIDTSGSISSKEVETFINEVRNCLDIVAEGKPYPSFKVIYCDAVVQGVDIIEDNYSDLNVKGGGGTRFSPVFKYIQDHEDDFNPDALFYITDGMCNDFGNIIPDYPVLWCVTSGYMHYVNKAPFGEAIEMEVY